MSETLSEQFTKTDDMKLYQQERIIFEVTELVCKLMEQKEINKTELSNKLKKSKGYVTQLLNGTANMTLRTISDVMWVLDSSLHVEAGPLSVEAHDPRITEGDLSIGWAVSAPKKSKYKIARFKNVGHCQFSFDTGLKTAG